MIKKLFALVKNECALETPDNPMNQEILLPGHLYMIVLKVCVFCFSNFMLNNLYLEFVCTNSNF